MSDANPPQKRGLDSEIEAALDSVDLQSIDLEPTQGSPGAGGGARLMPGTVVGVSGDDVFVELGPRMQGVCSRSEFDKPPAEGDVLEFALRGREDDLWVLSRKEARTLAGWRELAPGKLVKGTVVRTNSGGLEVEVGPIQAFIPASQAALGRVEDLSTLVGQTMVCEVLEVDERRKRVTLSRRVVLEREREEARSEAVGALLPGEVLRAKVARIEPFGAFLEIKPGLEGLLHVSNYSRKRVEKLDDEISVGDVLEVQVLEITEGGKRIALSRKALEPDPWDHAQGRYAPDSMVTGKVVRVVDFGAFVELEPGLEGLIHVSQLGRDRVRRPSDVISLGEEVTVRVVNVEPDRQRIGLSRLDARGAVLGSEEAGDPAAINEVLQSGQGRQLGTNLGDLLRKARK
jgi:ribosomal protein S1